MDWANLDRLRPHDEVKFVIKDRADYEFARDVIASATIWPARAAAIHFSPVHGVLDPRTLSEWVLADRLPRARPAAAAQVHLGPGHARRLTPSSCSAAASIPTPPRRSRARRASGCTR